MKPTPLLPTIRSPEDLRRLTLLELERLAAEMRETLCGLVEARSAHFASNLGVVELCLALHTTFDFLRDRLIWDTGHQVYPHKLVTGRYDAFPTIRTKGGLMGYPNPAESPYDLFMTGHAGASVSTALGLASGDALARPEDGRWSVAVIGDGAFPSGPVYEALNNVKRDGQKLLVVLNDNRMSICPRVGGVADYLDRLRMNRMYAGLKDEVARVLSHVPLLGDPTERFLAQLKEAAKAGFHGGMLFEEFGMRYLGPIDGHNIALVRKYLRMIKGSEGPVLLHVVTEKGHGFGPAEEDPVTFHAPPRFERSAGSAVTLRRSDTRGFTHVARDAVHAAMGRDDRVTVMTAAMCQGNLLEPVRTDFPDRFFDTGICEAHTVAFAAGQAKAGLRPIVDVYSTFLQRAFDHVFQEVALQNLPVTFLLDRGGVAGPDGPTHHGVFDLGYLRLFPNMVVAAPGDAADLPALLDWALTQDGPVAIRYPKAVAYAIEGPRAPIELGRAEVLRDGADGAILVGGALVAEALAAADTLRREDGLELTVVNARFVKPLDTRTILPIVERSPWVVTLEEAALAAGFGSAVAEASVDAGVAPRALRRLGVPDRYVEHGERGELLADLGLDAAGVARACRELAAAAHVITP